MTDQATTIILQSIKKSKDTLILFVEEFEILKHEIQQTKSKYSQRLFEILDTNKKIFNTSKSLEETDLDNINNTISQLIKLNIDQNDDLYIIRNILVIFFSIFIRAFYADEHEKALSSGKTSYTNNSTTTNNNSNSNDDTELEMCRRKTLKIFTEIYQEISESNIDDAISPLLFFFAVFCASNGDDKNSHIGKILTSFDIFNIIRIKWLKRAYHVFTEKTYKILNHSVYFALSIFFFIISFSNYKEVFERKNVPSLLIYIFKHQKENDDIGLLFINNFMKEKEPSKYSFNKFDEFYFQLAPRAIKNSECASIVMKEIENRKSKEFMKNLQNSLDELVSTNDKDQNVLYSIQLLYKFCKYLETTSFESFIAKCFKSQSNGIDTEQQDESENDDFSSFITFVYFITDFLWKPKYCIYAAKILEKLTLRYPIFMADYYNSLFRDRFSDLVKIIDDSSNNHRLIISFIRASNYFIHYHFSYQTPIKELPLLVEYTIFDFFPSAVYRKYKTKRAQWKVFTELIETALDLILTDYSYLLLVHENEKFIASLIILINYSAKNIYITFKAKEQTDSSDKKTSQPNDKPTPSSNDSPDDNLDDDSKIKPLNYRDADFQLNFEIKSLMLLHYLLSIHIIKNEKPTLLYTELFNDQWISKLIESLTNFLILKCSSPDYEEISDKIYKLRSLSFDIFELLCNACSKNKDGNNSFEVYYPTKFQDIYNNIIYGSLYESQSFDEMIRVIDFASAVIDTQKIFAYSLIRHHYFGIIAEVLNKFEPENIKLECDWVLLASVAKLASKIFIEFNSRTLIIQHLLYPEILPKDINPSMNNQNSPTIKNPAKAAKDTNDQNLSKVWCKVVKFIFNDQKFPEILKDNNKILVAARFLKSIICIYLYMDCSLPDSQQIQKLLTNFFTHLFEVERKTKFNIETSVDIDMNDFKSYIMYPSPDEFYIDTGKLKWFLNSEDDGLIKGMQDLNKLLYTVDCKTELITSIHSFIQSVLIINQNELFSGFQINDIILGFINDALKINFLPVTTVEEVFKLFQTIIMFKEKQNQKQQPATPPNPSNPSKSSILSKQRPPSLSLVSPEKQNLDSQTQKGQGLNTNIPKQTSADAAKKLRVEFSDEKLIEVLSSARDFLKESPNSTVFQGITKLLQMIDERKNDIINNSINGESGRILADLFTIACKYVEKENPDENATSLAIEISYKISDDPTILEGESANIYLSFFKSVINTKFAIHALKATRILCSQKYSTENLEKVGFFDYLIKIMEPDHGELKKNSPLWPHIFSIFLSLPPESHITANFICKCFPFITFFLNASLKNDDTQLAQTKESIVNLVAHISKNISVLSAENPSTTRALTELIYIQFDFAAKSFFINSVDSKFYYKDLVKIELHNVQTACILILHSCLIIFNNLSSHPFMELPQGFQKSDFYLTMMSLLVGIMENLYLIMGKIDENNNETDKRLQFVRIAYRSAEMAAQLFNGLLTSNFYIEEQSKDEIQKMKDNHGRFIKAAIDIENLVKGMNIEDVEKNDQFWETILARSHI